MESLTIGKYSKVLDLPCSFNIDNIMNFADCRKDNPNYDSYLEILHEVIEEKINCIVPTGYVVNEKIDTYTKHDGLGVINCLVTIGDTIDEHIDTYMKNSDYLEGLFLTLLGDSVLFQASNHMYNLIQADLLEENCYLSVRMEPGDIEIDVRVQGEIFSKIKYEFDLDIFITDGYMISPSKTLAYFYRIDSSDESKGVDHSCQRCLNETCKNRSVGCSKFNT